MLEQRPRLRIYADSTRTSLLVYILIASLSVTFLAIFAAYIIRFIVIGNSTVSLEDLPILFWWSTGFLFTGSYFLSRAYALVQREKQKQFRVALSISLFLAAAFCVVQTIGCLQLLDQHWGQPALQKSSLATIMVLVTLHVAHFVAGFIALIFVTIKAHQGRYDHEYAHGVRLAKLYWRFLDIVWIAMVGLFWVASRS
ncbi:MAG: hypothetical protein JKY95_13420 [Planctomycetaceae bacterium]|nr:hypothetical protein [Planctomycetaceae bacterium]